MKEIIPDHVTGILTKKSIALPIWSIEMIIIKNKQNRLKYLDVANKTIFSIFLAKLILNSNSIGA